MELGHIAYIDMIQICVAILAPGKRQTQSALLCSHADNRCPQPVKASTLKQSSLQASFSRSVPYETKSDKWHAITNAVSHHIAKDMVPYCNCGTSGIQKTTENDELKIRASQPQLFYTRSTTTNVHRSETETC